MSLRDCIDVLNITDEELVEYKKAGDVKKLLNQKKADARRRKDLLLSQKLKHEELLAKVFSHPEGATVGLRSLLTNDLNGLAGWSNIEYRQHAIHGQAISRMVDVMDELSNSWFGLTRGNVSLADDVIRELHGTPTGSTKAVKLARQWSEVAETMRLRFNKSGGDIGKLDTWGLPQSHSQGKVHAAGKEAWIDFITPRLRDVDELDLDKIYETISSGGLNKVDEPVTVSAGGKMTANLHNEERVLHFKDGNAWLEYNNEFGRVADPLSIMEDHIRVMARDIAKIEIMGVNPDNMFKTLSQEVKHHYQKQQLETGTTTGEGSAAYTEAIWNVVSGKVDETAAFTKWGKRAHITNEIVRGVQTAAKLGSATLSSISDVGTLFVNTSLHGINPFRVLKTALHSLTPVAGLTKQKQVAELGFALEIFNSSITARFDEVGSHVTSKAAEAVMRASGMNWWTEALRKTWQYEFYNHLERASKKEKLAKIFKDYGWTHDEVRALDFDNLELSQQTRLLEMVNQEGDYAVMMPTARTRAITTGGKQRGTFFGELSRTGMQFKSFPATFMIQQLLGRLRQKNMSALSRAGYVAALLTTTTMLGALAMMAKDKAKGYVGARKGAPYQDGDELFPEGSSKFWAAALIQGGGAGILGDILFSDQNRYGGSVVSSITPPVIGTIERAVKLTVGNAQEALAGEDTNFGSEAVEFLNREANPLNLWYTKALLEMYVVEDLKMLLDPEYERAKMRKDRKRRREYEQDKADTVGGMFQ